MKQLTFSEYSLVVINHAKAIYKINKNKQTQYERKNSILCIAFGGLSNVDQMDQRHFYQIGDHLPILVLQPLLYLLVDHTGHIWDQNVTEFLLPTVLYLFLMYIIAKSLLS